MIPPTLSAFPGFLRLFMEETIREVAKSYLYGYVCTCTATYVLVAEVLNPVSVIVK